jgi:hypothetical protein
MNGSRGRANKLDGTDMNDGLRNEFALNHVKPFACLAFPLSQTSRKQGESYSFGDELVTSYVQVRPAGSALRRQVKEHFHEN